MGTEIRRLFVGNLPDQINEQELKNEFSAYGPVKSVEVKHKKDPYTDEIKSTFAFIVIDIDEQTTRQCIQEFKQEKFRGKFLQVTVARENFLEKLKREREETSHLVAKNQTNTQNELIQTIHKVELPTIKSSKKSSSSSSSSSESEEEPEKICIPISKHNGKKNSPSSPASDGSSDENEIIVRKQSKKTLKNGKIQIDSSLSSGTVIHVIERNTTRTDNKSLDENSKKADQRRIDSMMKMKNSYNEQKMAIKNALSGFDSTKRSNKIVFSDDGDINDIESKVNVINKMEADNTPIESKKKPKLFGDEDDEEDESKNYKNDFEIKEQFQGVKGEKLMRLQTRFQGDRRFAMDAKFLDDEYEMNVIGEKIKQNAQNNQNKNVEDVNEERNWQYNILESVIGKRLRHDQFPKESKKKTVPSMLRFDPTRADHTQFEEEKGKKKRKKQNVDNEIESKKAKLNEEESMPISMEQFYEVRSDLKKSMGGGGGFSLLSMFGRDENIDKCKNIDYNPYEEKPMAKNSVKILADLDPFKYDSSGDEAELESKTKIGQLVSGNKSKIVHESFFLFSASDERFRDGIEFFMPSEHVAAPEENNEEKKQELRNIVKRKIKKSIQNLLPRHAKPNKRFRNFAKNLQ